MQLQSTLFSNSTHLHVVLLHMRAGSLSKYIGIQKEEACDLLIKVLVCYIITCNDIYLFFLLINIQINEAHHMKLHLLVREIVS